MLYRLDYEIEFIVSVMQTVFVDRQAPPAVDAAESHLGLVHADVRSSRLDEVGRMSVVLSLAVIEHFDAVFES